MKHRSRVATPAEPSCAYSNGPAYTHIYIYIYMHIYAYIYICIQTYIYIYINICLFMNTFIYMHESRVATPAEPTCAYSNCSGCIRIYIFLRKYVFVCIF